MRVLLVGTGPMALEYSKVLQGLDIDFVVVGRGEESARDFEATTGIRPIIGGLQNFLRSQEVDRLTHGIIATSVDQLAGSTFDLSEAGVPYILVEKPAGLTLREVQNLGDRLAGRQIFVAYNRRFFSSVDKVREIIKEDGGVRSFSFEFTEWSSQIEGLKKAAGVKENWFLANSSHVVDLAFNLGGRPKEISSFFTGELTWHKPAVFAGSGLSDSGALFTYQANWDAPGRWGVEILTAKRRLYLRPMEKLSVQMLQSVVISEALINDESDRLYKPGLFSQVKSFLFNLSDSRLCRLDEHVSMLPVYSKMTGYKID